MVLGTSPELRSSSPVRVLVADDEPALRGAFAELLAHEDGVVLIAAAADADEAIEAAGDHQPDVAFVDVKMPAGGGEKAARGIVRVSPGTRVIALSAFEDRPTVLAMLRAGAVGYLVKGIGAEEIVGSIERVMAGGTSLSPEVIGGIVQELTSQLRKEEIEEETREARRGEIERFMAGDGLSMVFQPIMDLRTRSTVGLEALARFRSLPLRPPNEWFAEAVQLELGVQLELTTVRQALHALPFIPLDTFLAVNCSHRTAVSPQLASILSVDAGRIVVEITEHEAIEDYDALLPRLADLRDSGVRVAIDDAGAGFASLRHTLQIAPDIVKLDISLTRDIGSDRARQALASALVAFAQEMDISVVAEGIETQDELDMLLELGVRLGQGFFLSEPSPLRGLEPA